MTAIRLILRIALRQALGRRGLTTIAALGVAFGVIALVTMNAIMKGFQERFKDQIINTFPHVTVEEERLDARPSPIAEAEAGPIALAVSHRAPDDRPARIRRHEGLTAAIRRLPGVSAACGILFGQLDASVGARRFDLPVRGVDPEPQDRCTPIARYVRTGSWRDFVASTDSIVVGARMAKEFGLQVGDRIRVRLHDGSGESLRVAAIFESGIFSLDRQVSYVHLRRAQALLDLDAEVNRIDVRVTEPFAADEVARRLGRLTRHKSVSWLERAASDLAVFKLQNLVVTIQVLALLVVGGFGILAVQIMMVLQKTHDISILRSVGLRRRDVMAVFVTQGVLIAIAGGLLGDLVAWRLVEWLDSLVDKTRPYSETALYVMRDPPSYVWGLAFGVVVGALASLAPAWRGARVEPVEVLRGRIG